ncbi:hypothetical protein LAG90_17560 [Marinilongibacter aquaticus]|uniref:hypothetical protein n=1 Tax=Marinilongibacter aquaticus TaxID=2975157 RepID=UPI0021BD0D63|nr:hypothetical protein [Marinilongibacter aquaticus]UBM58609.1 hypothetical protein LAG90_17560 [Marinilongibacter aquaticus]
MEENMGKSDWRVHNDFARGQGLQPSAPLARAFDFLSKGLNLKAADLGCGAGIDALAMHAKGWEVLAMDRDAQAVSRLQSIGLEGLEARVGQFERLLLPPLDLINASMALPFCAPDYFSGCWHAVVDSLANQKGYFCGHFFGVNDSWSTREYMNFVDRDILHSMFRDFDILWIDETEKDGKTLDGTNKHWHLFSVFARIS